ncbi:MAG TPA: PKD domain-containing protein, partial [Cyclobacteriaceae bacterium]|nr:PKD domain-containing protein [Cyclobacteriaceae bacterium]
MLKLLLNLRFGVFLIVWGIVSFSTVISSFAQGCLGTTGSGPTGGAISTSPGYRCANVDFAQSNLGDPTAGAEIKISAGKVAAGDNVSFIVNWGDGTGDPIAPLQIGPNDWEITGVKHLYPTTGSTVSCEYIPTITLIVNNVVCSTNFGSSPTFVRWNVDTENSGILKLTTKTSPFVNVYNVCKGSSATVIFKDRSNLNCGPLESNPDNSGQRWRRFTYGTTNTITSATGVKVGGIVQPYPLQAAVITNLSVVPSNSPIFSTETLPITVPADAQAGEEFVITMEYWNTCNPYPATAPVTETARIVIVDQPTAPVAQNVTECGSITSTDGFYISSPPVGSIVTWYFNDTSGPVDAAGSVIKSSTSPFLLFTEAGSPNPSTPGVYKVWASYHETTGTACESIKVPVTITNLTPTVTAIAGADQPVCDQLTSLSLGANTPSSGTGQWSIVSKPSALASALLSSTTDPSATVTVDTQGDYIFKWEVTDGVCTVSDDIKVTFDKKPSAPAQQPTPFNICDPTIMLTANPVDKGGSGQWSSTSPVTIIPINTASTTVSNLGLGGTVVTWTVSSAFGACPDQTADYNINRSARPIVNNSVPPLCEDSEGSGHVTNVLLSDYNDMVTGIVGSANRTVTWYSDAAKTNAVTSFTITNNLKLYVRVENTATTCSQDRDIIFTVYSLPLAVDQSGNYCETVKRNNQSPSVNLALDFNDKIVSSNPVVNVIKWFDNSSGVPVQLTAGQIGAFSYVGSASLIAQVQNTTTGCINEASISLGITTRPDDNPILLANGTVAPPTLRFCASEDIVVLHVDPTANPGSTFTWTVPSQFEIVGGGTPNFYVLLRFKTAQALSAINVQEFKNGSCGGGIQSVNVIVDAPASTGPVVTGDLQVCTNQQGATYSVQSPDPTSTYSWQLPSDAFIIGDNTASTIHVLWGSTDGNVRAQEKTSGGCVSPLSNAVSVHVNQKPEANSLFPVVCADDNNSATSVQNLTLLEPSISSVPGVTFTWYDDPSHASAINPVGYTVSSATHLEVVVSNGLCDNQANVSFTVTPFFPGAIGGFQSVCAGSSTVTLANLNSPSGGVSGTYLFQWQSSPDNFVNPTSITDLALATDIVYDPGVVSVSTYYRRKVTIGSCAPQFTSSVKVTALALPTGDFSVPGQICAKDADAKLNFNFTSNGPFKFDYQDDKGNVYNGVIGSAFTAIGIPGLTENTTYTLTRVEDVNTCAATLSVSHTVQVLEVSADFTIDLPLTKCSGEEFVFHWDVDPNVTYTWIWGDGESVVVNPSAVALLNQEQRHKFKNASPSTVFNYPVQLKASADNGSIACEANPVTKNISVNPTVQPSISPEKLEVCSGEEIQFNNQSVGAVTSEWYVDDVLQGTTVGNDPFKYTFVNTTLDNPKAIEVRYKGINPYCPAEATFIMQVYKEVNAAFTYLQTKEFSGFATVAFTNTSSTNLIDPNVAYSWTFGDLNDATPGVYSGANATISVDYNSPGLKYVTLTAVNTSKSSCVATKSTTVNVVRPP